MELKALEQMFGLKGQTVMVTGAAGQLGRDLTNRLVSLGANVVATDITGQCLGEAREKEGWPDESVLTVPCNVVSEQDVISAIEAGRDRFGEVTAFVNNAGISVFEPFHERKEEDFDRVMDVNLKGTFFCIRKFIEYRKGLGEKPGGCIVNISSLYGVVSPDPRIYTDTRRNNSEVYGATKAGIVQMTKYFAVHSAPFGIRVNAVSPGGIFNAESPQGEDFIDNYSYRCPMGRMARTEEITSGVLYLLSQAASYVNGHNLVIDGGFTSW
ncbi:MAG: SDR family oxidoreductase [Thermodesulfovibrionales bacterium]|nr:SDR family oxidoreductase [Thermodesulfovibrionales bacterium]